MKSHRTFCNNHRQQVAPLARSKSVMRPIAKKAKDADAILNLLASKLSDFHFEHENGIVSITLKRAASLGYLAAYAGIATKHHNSLKLSAHELDQVLTAAALPVGIAADDSAIAKAAGQGSWGRRLGSTRDATCGERSFLIFTACRIIINSGKSADQACRVGDRIMAQYDKSRPCGAAVPRMQPLQWR